MPEGLDGIVIGITYLYILVLAAILFIGRYAYEQSKKKRETVDSSTPLQQGQEMESAS